jgi:hypothetical protein
MENIKILRCKKEAIDDDGEKIMNFTKDLTYIFKWTSDPEGWEVFDDNGNKETFFNLDLMFEEDL